MIYLIITLVLISCMLIYFRLAARFNIIDKPNERSSHSSVTIRGGGIIFPIVVMIAFILGYAAWPLTLAVLLVAIVSFVDDIRPLSQFPRFGTHLLASVLVLYEVGLFDYSLWWVPVALFLLIGWVNIFNFMDGINGITVLYSLVSIASLAVLPVHEGQMQLLFIVGISCAVFGFFNVRKKARSFAGDVGSVSIALFLGYFMVKTMVITHNPFYLFFFTLYGVDAIFTILFRVSRRENIFLPHRSHLYQYLANERKIPHVTVSLLYAAIQLAINLSLIYLLDIENFTYWKGLIFIALCCLVYLVVRGMVVRTISTSER
jgi:UDP-N-acetylmuramyl pentapeptide phosphotransferase/UDP-N-acetylglucosamine-1-phosphate transferase